MLFRSDFFSGIDINQKSGFSIFSIFIVSIGSAYLWLKREKNQDIFGKKIQSGVPTDESSYFKFGTDEVSIIDRDTNVFDTSRE